MARLHELKWNTKQEMINAVSDVLGHYTARDPVPEWWELKTKSDPGWSAAADTFFEEAPSGCWLRTEAFEIDEDDAEHPGYRH